MTLRLQSLAGKASWAILDHALFSGAGMLTSVLLARGMLPNTYGAYAVSFAVYMAVFVLHNALFAEPMLVLSAHRFRERIGSYLRIVLKAHVVFSLASLPLLAAAAYGFARGADQTELRYALLAMGLAAPFMNLAQLLRRLCYSLSTPRHAAEGALAYLIAMGAALTLLYLRDALSLGTAYAALASSSLVASLGWLWRLRAAHGIEARGAEPLTLGDVARAHSAFARYGFASSLLGWVPLNVWYVALPFVAAGEARLSASGHLRALVNLIQPMLQVNGAFITLLVPTYARMARGEARANPWRLTAWMTAFAAAYSPFLGVFGPFLNRVFYRGAYPADALTWWVLGAVPASTALAGSLRAYCLGRERPELPLMATAISAFGCVTFGLALCAWQPLRGASLAMLLGFALQALALAWLVPTRRV